MLSVSRGLFKVIRNIDDQCDVLLMFVISIVYGYIACEVQHPDFL